MGIASYKPDVVIVEPSLPKVEPVDYSSIITDNKENRTNSLLPYIEGSAWTVDYFSQVLSKHNDIREIDSSQSNVYQQYNKIIGLELKVTAALTDSYDTETSITTVTGNGFVYAGLVPNINDYFVSNAGSNRSGLFRVTTVERKSFNRDSVYYIEYTLVNFTEEPIGETLYLELNDKSIRTYYFSKDRILNNLQPLVKEEEHQQIFNLKNQYEIIVKYYFDTFFNRKYSTLVLPGQEKVIYDSFLTDYVLKITGINDHLNIMNIRQLPIDNEIFIKQDQFWSLLMNRIYDDKNIINQKMTLISKYIFNKDPYIKGIYFYNIDYLLYPVNGDKTIHIGNIIELPTSELNIIETTNVHLLLSSDIVKTYEEANITYNLIYPVLHDEYYVLSENFYNNTDQQSILEILVKDYLKHQTIDMTKLLLLCNAYKDLGRLEQFYFGPIIITLIKESDRNIYS